MTEIGGPGPAIGAAPSTEALLEPAPLLETTQPRQRNRWTALAEVILCSGFPTQLALIFAFAMMGFQPLLPDGTLSLAYVAILSLVDAVLLIGLVFLFLMASGDDPRTVLLGHRPLGREVGFGLLLVPLVFALVVGISALILRYAAWLHNLEQNPLEALLKTPLDAAIFAVVAVGAGGLREEIQRAFILTRFEQSLGGAPLGILLFSIVFGAGHMLQGYDAAIVTGVLGALWGYVYWRRRSIVAPFISHAAFNLIEVGHFGFS